jgi:hypothetical protein
MPSTPECGPRQAIVLIHGIGEQRPMETLRGFVKAFLEDGTYHSKPDPGSDSFELRRFKLRRWKSRDHPERSVNTGWPQTDFYEYYWAHQMYGTTIAHVLNWAWIVMRHGLKAVRSNDERYHKRLRWLVPLVWFLAIAAVIIVVFVSVRYGPRATVATGVVAALAITGYRMLRAAFFKVFTDFVGDAARYFDVTPVNIARRTDIIRGGVELLRRLHVDHDTKEPGDDIHGDPNKRCPSEESNPAAGQATTNRADPTAKKVLYRYGRIVLVGHSLGSVIAYDILRHYWHQVNGKIQVQPTDFHDLENYLGDKEPPQGDGFTAPLRRQSISARSACCLAENQCPLSGRKMPRGKRARPRRALAGLRSRDPGLPDDLCAPPLAKDIGDLESKINLRELPICPPDRSRHLNRGRFTVKLSAEADKFRDYDILPQTAQFAVTRWTNFFFDNDPIGGRLGRIFGPGVEDHELKGPPLRPLTAHTGYWEYRKLEGAMPCVDYLKKLFQNVCNEGSLDGEETTAPGTSETRTA